MIPDLAAAQYNQRANVTTAGALTFTGNTLGLDGDEDNNRPGTRGAIETFITTDPSLQDGGFPPGTTAAWQLNRSEATLRLPSGARVIRAELIWGGTFADRQSGSDVSAFIDDPIRFTTPGGSFDVSPDSATAITEGDVEGNGSCDDETCFYVRSADVTSLVTAGGRYATGRVPATQSSEDESNPVAGWTLAVFYEDFTQPIRNLTMFLGLEPDGGASAAVTGFCTPSTGPVTGRLAVSAIEGDARYEGDKLLFGRSANLDNDDRVEGPRNPKDNFFSGQITNDVGSLDTSGTFGNRNHSPGDPEDGARQGWDITNVDASDRLQNNQTTAFARGATDGDRYRIMALGLQIDIGAPKFFNTAAKEVDRAFAQLGDILTYTIHVDNTLGTADANDVVFFDLPPQGTTFVAGSVTVDGAPRPGADPAAGVPLGTIARGDSVDVTLQVRVDSFPAGPNADIRANKARWTFTFVSCPGQTPLPGAAESNTVVTVVPVADLSIAKAFVTSPAVAGSPVTYTLTVRNAGPSIAPGVVISDAPSTPPLTGITWTCTPESAGSSCGAPTGVGPVSSTATLPPGGGVVYRATGLLPASTPAGTLGNSATVTAPASVPDLNTANNSASASVPIVTRADVQVAKTGPATGQRGNDVSYSIVVTNNGPSDAVDVLVTDPAPQDLTLVSFTGPCTTAPGCALAVGDSQTITAVFNIPPGYPVTSPDPIVNTATVTTATTDPKPVNNTARANTALDAPVADLSIVKTNNVSSVTAGAPVTYTITVANAGPATAPNASVVDVFDPAVFTGVTWTCAPSGTSTSTCLTASGSGDINTTVTLQPGAGNEVVFTVQASVLPTASGVAENTATVATATGESDSNTTNNSSTDTDPIEGQADISIVKTGPATIVAGTSATYTLVVTNDGPSVASNIPVTDRMFNAIGTFQPQLITAYTAPAGVTCTLRPFLDPFAEPVLWRVCDVPTLAVGATATFTVTVTIPPDDTAPVYTNVAYIDTEAYTGNDPDTTDHTSTVPIAITTEADVAVAKTGPEAVVAGSTVSYFVQVTNNGPSTATNVVVQDPLPPGLVFVGVDGPCTSTPCTIASLAPGEGSSTRVDVLVPPDYSGPSPFVNTATVQTTGDPNPANDTASISTTVLPEQADVRIEKSGPSVVAPGGQLQYRVRVSNLGPGPARDVVWADALPGGMTFVSGTPPGAPTTCSVPPAGTLNVLQCLTPLLDVGASLEVPFIVQAAADLEPGSVLTNVATATSPTPDINLANNRAELATIVGNGTEADLLVEKTDNPDPVVIGGNVTYTVVVRNQGPAQATNVTLTDTLPAGLTLVLPTPSQGTCTGTTCSLGTIAAGANATVSVVATATVRGVVVNTATAAASEVDPTPANNTATEQTTVADATDADLAIEKVGPTVLAPGDSSVYTITVTNRGPAAALLISIEDPLPTGVTFIANADGCVTPFPCGIERLEPGESKVIRTAFTLDAGVTPPATIVNTATVLSALTPDPDPGNNTSSLTSQVLGASQADLVIAKVDSPDPVVAGTALSYTITVGNRGPATATGVTVTDPLPAGMTATLLNTTLGTCSGTTTVTCQLGDLPKGAVVEIQIVTTAPAEAPTPNPMINTVTVTSGTTDPDPGTNTSTIPTTVIARSDVGVTKSGPLVVAPGMSFAYAIAVTNTGPSSATGVVLTDPIPAGLTLSAVTGDCTALPCALGSIPTGTTRNIQVQVQLPASAPGTGTIVNTATVTSASTDTDPTNNTATVTTAVTPSIADLTLTKVGPATIFTGRTIAYTITVSNAGPSDAPGVVLTDPTPAQLTFVSASAPCASGFPCTLGTLAVGASVTVTATYQVPANFSGSGPIVNTATANATGPDPTPADNTATVQTTVRRGVTVCDFNGDGRAEIVIGVGRRDGGAHVRILSYSGTAVAELVSFQAYFEHFPGGVFVACGDVTGDGYPEVVTGADIGGDAHVGAFQVTPGTFQVARIASFYANQPPAFVGGVRVAIGDVDGDGVGDIVTAAGAGDGPIVKAFTLAGGPRELGNFNAYSPSFNGGVFVASCDMNNDGRAEIITGVGRRDGGPHVRVLNVAGGTITELVSFQAYVDRFPGGVFVACGDVTGDGINEIVTGADVGGDAHARDIMLVGGVPTGGSSFYVYPPPDFPGGVRVAVGDVDGDGVGEIITGLGTAGPPLVRVIRRGPNGTVTELFNFNAYATTFNGGVYVASGSGR